MTRRASIIANLALVAVIVAAGAAQAARLKDMASIHGVRGNQLIGYGLVMGLNGTGDKAATTFTVQGLSNMLNRMGVKVSPDNVKVKNVAAVMVTAELPAFARAGSRIDVTLSSIGDSDSLAGGTLVMTPLRAVDGNIYAVAQGPVSVGGFTAGGQAATVSKNHPTVGRIPSGAVIERELTERFGENPRISINLRVPDFTVAARVAQSIQSEIPTLAPRAVDPSTIEITLPASGLENVALMARLENLEIEPDMSSKVVVDERTGTVVMGEGVRISTVAVASGALSISVTESADVSQALPFAPGGETVVVPSTDVTVGEQKAPLAVVRSGVSIGQVVSALNALGATPRDLIVILQAIEAAGALQAKLEII